MKTMKVLFLVIFFGILSFSTNVFCQYQYSENGYIKEDSMNLVVFVLDFQTYEFIEADVNHYPLCDSCDYLGIPFIIDFFSPGDFGYILYTYLFNHDTLFDASIIWMGIGEIDYPDQFLPTDSFETTNNHIPLLENAQYYDYWLIPFYYTWAEYKQKADSAWLSIDSLLIVNEFADYSYRVGFYAYTPQVGLFNPDVAKWIVFLYYGNDYLTDISVNRLKNLPIDFSPNPSSGTIRINNYQSVINRPYEVINTQNKTVLRGSITNELISLADLENGIYLIRIWSGNEYVTKKIILSK